jgi:hypothetical protein
VLVDSTLAGFAGGLVAHPNQRRNVGNRDAVYGGGADEGDVAVVDDPGPPPLSHTISAVTSSCASIGQSMT